MYFGISSDMQCYLPKIIKQAIYASEVSVIIVIIMCILCVDGTEGFHKFGHHCILHFTWVEISML